MIAEARANGWDTINSPSQYTDVLVAADPDAKSAKLLAARGFGTPIVSSEDWTLLMQDGVLPD